MSVSVVRDEELRQAISRVERPKLLSQLAMVTGWIKRRYAILVCAFICPIAAIGEEGEAGSAPTKNRLELFVGATHVENRGASADEFSLGITYERRVSDRIGVGGLVEFTDGTEAWIWGVPLFIHPIDRVRLTVAAGAEFAGSRQELLIRTGVAYEFELGKFSIAPELNVDFVDGERNEVYGISVGFGF